MALNDRPTTNNTSKVYEPTYYSRIGIKNYSIDKRINFSFRSGMLIVEVSKEKGAGDFESIVAVHVTPTKANIMIHQIEAFEEDVKNGLKDINVGYGINTGMGEIQTIMAIHVTENGNKGLTIGKIDGSGKYTVKEDVPFNHDFHYGLKWNNINSMECEKQFINSIDFEMFKAMIKQVADAGYGAYGYFATDLTRYDNRSLRNMFTPIYNKLGIEFQRQSGSNNKGYGGNNFFENKQGVTTHKNLDELEDGLPFGEDD